MSRIITLVLVVVGTALVTFGVTSMSHNAQKDTAQAVNTPIVAEKEFRQPPPPPVPGGPGIPPSQLKVQFKTSLGEVVDTIATYKRTTYTLVDRAPTPYYYDPVMHWYTPPVQYTVVNMQKRVLINCPVEVIYSGDSKGLAIILGIPDQMMFVNNGSPFSPFWYPLGIPGMVQYTDFYVGP